MFCSLKCSADAKKNEIAEDELIECYRLTKIGIRSLCKKFGVRQDRVVAILRNAGFDTSLGKRRHAKGASSTTYRKTVEASIGRTLEPDDWVHHIDGDRTNNTIDNLQVMKDWQHRVLHRQIEQVTFDLFKLGLLSFNSDKFQYEPTAKLRAIIEETKHSEQR